jgi:hypothetical protein
VEFRAERSEHWQRTSDAQEMGLDLAVVVFKILDRQLPGAVGYPPGQPAHEVGDGTQAREELGDRKPGFLLELMRR